MLVYFGLCTKEFSMKVLFYSSVNIDMVFHVDHIVAPGETQSSFGVSVGAGGKGANQAAALAKALNCVDGPTVYLAGKCGDDGKFILDKLSGFGVDVSYMRRASCGTGQAIIQVDKDGQNSIILYGGGNQRIEREEVDETLSFFSKDDVLCVNCEINDLGYVIDSAYEKGMRIFLNPSPVNEVLSQIDFSKVSVLVVNEVEGAALAGLEGGAAYEDVIEALSLRWPSCEVVMTVGGDGAYYSFQGQTLKVSAVKTCVVDTTAAGDTFMGYFIASRLNGMNAEDSLKRAGLASSITVSRAGAMDSIPFGNEVGVLR